jgi:hypothetical protein
VVLFGISLLTLFFLFRHGESISMQCRTASQKLWAESSLNSSSDSDSPDEISVICP